MNDKNNKLLLWYNRLCDLSEVYLPCLIFLFMFFSYIVLIIYRYVLRASFDWLYELNTLSFVWCGIFAASRGSRTQSHVRFTILYDHVSPKLQLVMRLAGNLFVIALFVILFPKAIDNLLFLKVRKSSILKLPFNWVFAPFMIFLGLTILHHVLLVGRDILLLLRGKGEKA